MILLELSILNVPTSCAAEFAVAGVIYVNVTAVAVPVCVAPVNEYAGTIGAKTSHKSVTWSASLNPVGNAFVPLTYGLNSWLRSLPLENTP